MQNKSSSSETQNLLSFEDATDSRTKQFFNDFLDPNLTVPKIRWSHFWYVKGSTTRWSSLSLCLSSGTRPPGIYLNFTNCNNISCNGHEQGCRATSPKILTEVCAVSVFSIGSKFEAISSAHSGTCSICRFFYAMNSFLEPSMTINGPVVDTRACFSENVLLMIVSVSYRSCLPLWRFGTYR